MWYIHFWSLSCKIQAIFSGAGMWHVIIQWMFPMGNVFFLVIITLLLAFDFQWSKERCSPTERDYLCCSQDMIHMWLWRLEPKLYSGSGVRPKKGSKLRSDACMTASDGLQLPWQGITIKVTPTDAYRVNKQFWARSARWVEVLLCCWGFIFLFKSMKCYWICLLKITNGL